MTPREKQMQNKLKLACNKQYKTILNTRYYSEDLYKLCQVISLVKFGNKTKEQALEIVKGINESELNRLPADIKGIESLLLTEIDSKVKDRLVKDFDNILIVLTCSGCKFQDLLDSGVIY